MHAGHFIRKARGAAVYFEEKNINVQCEQCNTNLGGNQDEYYWYMLRTRGQDWIELLESLSRIIAIYRISDYEKLESIYKEKLKKFNEAN